MKDRTVGEGDWVLIHPQKSLGKIIEKVSLWGNLVFRIWLPSTDSIIRVDASALSPAQSSVLSAHHLTYLAAAARVADALTKDILIAPVESSVIPLPHQIRALSRAISSDRVRYLLADEVGLGKTIEAGLIMRELKLRGLVRRTLVIAPKGLVNQWVAEMAAHFNEEFRPIMSEDYRSLKRINDTNPFRVFNQIVVSMDSVKPAEGRGSNSARERFEDLIFADWDLVIVDEAHRIGGSTDQVARYRLGQGLAEVAPYLLLLTATPHQGKTEQFRRIMSLLDPMAFPDASSVTKERVQPYVIRTEKRRAIDANGKPLFKPRHTELVPISWKERHRAQKALYEAVTEYVREGYNQAKREKRSYIGFLMILMQRLVVSSTRAIKTTLERRLDVLNQQDAGLRQISLFNETPGPDDLYDLDAEEQLQLLLRAHLQGIRDEKSEVKLLLDAAVHCENQGSDAKAEALLDWIYRLRAEEGDPDLKVLVFTEFVPTQEMLFEFLTERGFKVVCLNGSMDMEERRKVQETFANDARILISTDAGGEGLNLQFCHVVVNYDIPWNPMRLEQRIGRVDRIGQAHTVRAINFVFEDSVEHRVREVLEQKLAVIFEEFGIDKTGDVLDSAQANQIFDDLYVESILNPDLVEAKIDEVLKKIENEIRENRKYVEVLGVTSDLDPHEAKKLLTHPFPHWVERMTVSFISAHGGKAEKINGVWNLSWPDGEQLTNVVFSAKEAHEKPGTVHLTLENPKIRDLIFRIPQFVSGQPIPVITLPDIAPAIMGFWSLWQISISTNNWNSYQIMPLFLADDNRLFSQTAQFIWDKMLAIQPIVIRNLDTKTSHQAFKRVQLAAEQQGERIFKELIENHRKRLTREREKGEYAFTARRNAISRIGLPEVRNHRLKVLEQEEKSFREQLNQKARILPELVPLAITRIEG